MQSRYSPICVSTVLGLRSDQAEIWRIRASAVADLGAILHWKTSGVLYRGVPQLSMRGVQSINTLNLRQDTFGKLRSKSRCFAYLVERRVNSEGVQDRCHSDPNGCVAEVLPWTGPAPFDDNQFH